VKDFLERAGAGVGKNGRADFAIVGHGYDG
jgi:hypothetical protein